MHRHLLAAAFGILLMGLTGCNIRTPEIQGVVLDEETKQPVEGAWIHADIEFNTKTIQGNVHSAFSVDKPHTRTDGQGKFAIPPKKFREPLPPSSFGRDVLAFAITANSVDDRGGGVRYFGGYYERDYGKGDGDLKKILGSGKIELTIYVKPVKRTESQYFHYLQGLYNYCLTGRFDVEITPVGSGCDDWELDYAIAKHEKYLDKLNEVKTSDQKSYYSGTLQRLGYLYKRKKDYRRALSIFKRAKEFDEQHYKPPIFWLKDIEIQIDELQQKLNEISN